MNQWLKYSKQYDVTIANAIRDRDYPMDRQQCIQEFLNATGKLPSELEIKDMSPDSQDSINDNAELQDWEDFDLGRR